MILSEIVKVESGTPQFRIKEDSKGAPAYRFYGQPEIESDSAGISPTNSTPRIIHTNDKVCTLKTNDLVFSLLSGKCAFVKPWHDGYLLTQNYIRLVPKPSIDAEFLAYMINENTDIKKQLHIGKQGSSVVKCTVRQITDLQLPDFPSLEKQKIIGCLYFNQLKLAALEKRLADSETKLVLQKLKEACAQ